MKTYNPFNEIRNYLRANDVNFAEQGIGRFAYEGFYTWFYVSDLSVNTDKKRVKEIKDEIYNNLQH